MAALYEVGQKVKVMVNELPYAGTILTYDENLDPVQYNISIDGLDVQIIEEDFIIKEL